MVDQLTGNHRKGTTGIGRQVSALSLIGGLVVGIAAGAAAWSWLTGDREVPSQESSEKTDSAPGVVELTEEAQRNASVLTAPATLITLPSTIELTGVVTPEESRVAHIRPLARGLIEEVSVRLGDRVKAGQTLVTYDNIQLGELIGDYLTSQATLRQAQTDLDVKRAALTRGEALIQAEAIAQQTLDQRRAEFQNAEASVASERARVSKVEEQIHRFGLSDAELAKLRPEEGQSGHRVASHTVLRASFDGIITKYDVAPGELVEPERELFTMANLSTVWVLADLYEKDLGKVEANTTATVRVEAYPERKFTGRVTYISDLIDPTTRTAKVRCVVANPDGALKLDMFARVVVPMRDRRQALTVPVAAIQQIDNQRVVFVRQSATRFERRDVQVGSTAGDRVEVSGALQAGDEVVGSGSFYLKTALLRERIAGEGD
jgi:cobalt-zinc-cadmium efflux system membrane fusion protein